MVFSCRFRCTHRIQDRGRGQKGTIGGTGIIPARAAVCKPPRQLLAMAASVFLRYGQFSWHSTTQPKRPESTGNAGSLSNLKIIKVPSVSTRSSFSSSFLCPRSIFKLRALSNVIRDCRTTFQKDSNLSQCWWIYTRMVWWLE